MRGVGGRGQASQAAQCHSLCRETRARTCTCIPASIGTMPVRRTHGQGRSLEGTRADLFCEAFPFTDVVVLLVVLQLVVPRRSSPRHNIKKNVALPQASKLCHNLTHVCGCTGGAGQCMLGSPGDLLASTSCCSQGMREGCNPAIAEYMGLPGTPTRLLNPPLPSCALPCLSQAPETCPSCPAKCKCCCPCALSDGSSAVSADTREHGLSEAADDCCSGPLGTRSRCSCGCGCGSSCRCGCGSFGDANRGDCARPPLVQAAV